MDDFHEMLGVTAKPAPVKRMIDMDRLDEATKQWAINRLPEPKFGPRNPDKAKQAWQDGYNVAIAQAKRNFTK